MVDLSTTEKHKKPYGHAGKLDGCKFLQTVPGKRIPILVCSIYYYTSGGIWC